MSPPHRWVPSGRANRQGPRRPPGATSHLRSTVERVALDGTAAELSQAVLGRPRCPEGQPVVRRQALDQVALAERPRLAPVAPLAAEAVAVAADRFLAVALAAGTEALEVFLVVALEVPFRPACFTASGSKGHTPRASFGPRADRTASLKVLAGVIRARFEALIRICSPVAGFRPIRAARSTFTNLANPVMVTGSPFATTPVTTSENPSSTLATVANSTLDWTATALARSRLFTGDIVHDGSDARARFQKKI